MLSSESRSKDRCARASALWEYREAIRQKTRREDTVPNAHGRLLELINRIQGGPTPAAPPAAPAFDREKVLQLRGEFAALGSMQPQPRGYAFEKFLRDLFTFYGLEARGAFRLVGEQIDGSLSSAPKPTCSKPSGKTRK